MSDQDRNSEQHDAAVLPERKKEIHIKIELGKRFCIFVAVLAALIAGVWQAFLLLWGIHPGNQIRDVLK